ncbi:ferritin-like domain-containing protein [Modestobacter roseus]|uniref:ferritin-like domain-containing protein n=1 Tax=Modestobacter roseus TaxID=1181884 RepID=UPI0034DE1DAF
MADGTEGGAPASGATTPAGRETAALQDALAATRAAIWGYGVVGAAWPAADRAVVAAAEEAHRDVRDTLLALLDARGVDPAPSAGGYTLPFPVLSPVDAAALAVTLEEGTSRSWTWVLDQAAEQATRELAVRELTAAELRAVTWRTAAGRTPVTSALPGL